MERRGAADGAIVRDTVNAPLGLLPAPLARLDARRGQTEWFVFNRAGLAKARLLHAAGILGRSAAVRGRTPRVT